MPVAIAADLLADLRGRRIETEASLLRRIEEGGGLRGAIHGCEVSTNTPRHRRCSRKVSGSHLFTLLLVAVDHHFCRPAELIALRRHRAKPWLIPENLRQHG